MIQNLSKQVTKAGTTKQKQSDLVPTKKSQTQYLTKEKFMPVVQLESNSGTKIQTKYLQKSFSKIFNLD